MNEDPRLQFDFYLRSRTEQELMKRAEVLLKAIKREGKQQQQQQQQQQQEEKTHLSQWEEEKASLQRDYESLTEAEAKLAEEVKQIDSRIAELQAKVRQAHEAQAMQMKQAAMASPDALAREKPKEKPRLRELSLSAPQLFQLVPFLDTLIAGVHTHRRRFRKSARNHDLPPLPDALSLLQAAPRLCLRSDAEEGAEHFHADRFAVRQGERLRETRRRARDSR